MVRQLSSSRMKFLLFFVLFVAFAAGSWARLGDTEGQLTERFGPPASRSGESIPSVTFVFGEWLVTCDLVGGLCARINYAKTGPWLEEMFEKLLLANGPRAEWSEMGSPGVKNLLRKWKRPDGTVAQWVVGCLSITSPRYEKAKAMSESEALIAATKS